MKNIIYLALFALILLSCEKDSNIVIPNDDNKTVNDFEVVEGYLHFSSVSSFKALTSKIANLSDEKREQWENKIGFKSQRRIVSNIINDELQIDSINQIRYVGVSIQDIPESELYSDSYKYYLSKGVIKVINKGAENEYWDYSLFSRSFIDYINEDGLFAIGDTLFRVTDTELLALTEGNFSDKELLLKSEKSKNKKVKVLSNYTKLMNINPNYGLIETDWKEEDKKRIKLGIYLNVIYYFPSNHHYEFEHEVYVQCQEKNWLGRWKYKAAEQWLDGDWDIRVFQCIDMYGDSFSWHGYANYLKLAINPETGEAFPDNNYFTVTASIPGFDDSAFRPQFDNYDWTATRWGGASGITVNLPADYAN